MSVDLERPRMRRADYERFLSGKLVHARNRIKAVDVASGIVICAVGAVAYALTVTMLDQIFTLSTTARVSLLAVFAAGTLGYAAFAVIIPSLRRVNLLFAAREVERADPNTKNSLINWLQLHDRDEEIPEPILRAIEARAASDLKRIDLGEAIQTTHILRASYVLAGVVVAFCLFLFATTKEIGPSLRRVLFPLSEIAPPTETKLTQIEPGSTEIAAGDKVTVSAFASGKDPKSVTVYVTADDGAYWEPIPLAQTGGAFSRWQVTLNDRQKSFDYYLAANDFKSPRFRVTVTAAPMVTEWTVTYHFPAYTKEPSRTDVGGDIDALEGTEVDIAVQTNVPVRPDSGRLELTFGKERRAEAMRAGTGPGSGAEAGAGAENQLTARIKLAEDGGYQVSFDDLLGRKPPFRPVKNIRVRRDLVPVLGFVEPKESDIQRPPTATVPLRLSASDDYGLASVRLVVARAADREVLLDQEIADGTEELGRSKVWVMPVELARMKLKAGDTLVYWAEAQDNKLPVSNVVSTKEDLRSIQIVEPPPQPKNPPAKEEKKPGGERQNPPKNQESKDSPEPNEPPPEQQQREGQDREGTGKQGQSSEGQAKEGHGQGQERGGQGNQDSSPSNKQNPGSKDQNPTDPGDQGAGAGSGAGEKGSKNDGEPDEKKDRADESGTDHPSQKQTDASPEDREALDKLKQHFDKKDGGRDSDNRDGATRKDDDRANRPDPPREGEQPDQTANEEGAKSGQKQEGEKKSAEAESKQEKGSEPTDGKGDAEPGEDQGAKQPGEGQKDQSSKQGGGESGNDKGESTGTQESKQDQGDAARQDKGTQGAEKSDGSGKEPGDGKSAGKQAQEKGAGRPGGETKDNKDKPQGDAQPGQPSEKDQGKESGESKDGSPRPGSEKKPDDKANPKGAHKEGTQDSAAEKEGNTDGQSSQGESSQSGNSSTGSPSEEKGDNPQAQGEQPGEGQSQGKDSTSQAPKEESQSKDGGPGESKPAAGQEGANKEKQGGAKEGSESTDSQGQGEGQSGEKSDSESKGDAQAETKPGGAEAAGNDPFSKRPEADDRPIGKPEDDVLDNSGDASDPEDLKRGSNLVLKRLKDQLKNKQVDPELLKDMGWTEEDARRFAERMDKPAPKETPKDPLVGKQREGFGGGTKLRKTANRGAGNVSDETGDLFQGRRAPPPPEYRALYEAYTRSLSGAAGQGPGNPTPKPAPGKPPAPSDKKP